MYRAFCQGLKKASLDLNEIVSVTSQPPGVLPTLRSCLQRPLSQEEELSTKAVEAVNSMVPNLCRSTGTSPRQRIQHFTALLCLDHSLIGARRTSGGAVIRYSGRNSSFTAARVWIDQKCWAETGSSDRMVNVRSIRRLVCVERLTPARCLDRKTDDCTVWRASQVPRR